MPPGDEMSRPSLSAVRGMPSPRKLGVRGGFRVGFRVISVRAGGARAGRERDGETQRHRTREERGRRGGASRGLGRRVARRGFVRLPQLFGSAGDDAQEGRGHGDSCKSTLAPEQAQGQLVGGSVDFDPLS